MIILIASDSPEPPSGFMLSGSRLLLPDPEFGSIGENYQFEPTARTKESFAGGTVHAKNNRVVYHPRRNQEGFDTMRGSFVDIVATRERVTADILRTWLPARQKYESEFSGELEIAKKSEPTDEESVALKRLYDIHPCLFDDIGELRAMRRLFPDVATVFLWMIAKFDSYSGIDSYLENYPFAPAFKSLDRGIVSIDSFRDPNHYIDEFWGWLTGAIMSREYLIAARKREGVASF